jgi:c-di-GMP-binding flagellar brake protein YcgR
LNPSSYDHAAGADGSAGRNPLYFPPWDTFRLAPQAIPRPVCSQFQTSCRTLPGAIFRMDTSPRVSYHLSVGRPPHTSDFMSKRFDKLRRFPRVKAAFSVNFEVNAKSGQAEAESLGGGGLFVGIAQTFSPGTEMKLRFRAAKHLPLIEAHAKVRYEVPGKGVGLEFTQIEATDRDRILHLVHHRAEDNRRYPRAPLAAQVEHEGGVFIGFSKDISAGGMFIETANALSPGSTLQIRFNVDNGPICKAVGEVRYEVKRLGVGIRFTHVSPEDQKRIDAFVAQNSD